nr:MAG: ORF1 [TTV-like mini virus]
MPFWRRYRRWYRRPRQRRYWRRRSRRAFSRRLWRRKAYRVRKKKLKKLTLKQWQPHYIRLLKVKGQYPMAMCTSQRLTNNLTCYLESIAPHEWPGGGGFSICNFSLNMLYKENLIANNYWTVTNDNLPLVRYLGCYIKLYRQPEIDWLFYYNNTFPMTANKLTYMSTQPQIMLQLKHIKILKCTKNSKSRKPYKKLYIRPPTQMQNKWYLQKDLANVTLLQTLATVASLDRKYLHANAVSSTMGFYSLNTEEIKNHYFAETQGTQGYQPLNNEKIFAIYQIPHNKKLTDIKIGDLIFLGQVTKNEPGTTIRHINNSTGTFQEKLTKALTEQGYQGNPFYKDYIHPDAVLVKTTKSLTELKNSYNSDDSPLKPTDFSFKTNLVMECRYNPFKDKGINNKVYLVKIQEQTHTHTWDAPTDPDIVWENLPLYILLWGYLDFQRKCGKQQQIDTNSCLVIRSEYISPINTTKIYVPLDDYFYNGHSPYADYTYPSDMLSWHPSVRHQIDSVNKIGATGPNTIKLQDKISCEAFIGYDFRFKIGGEPAPMSILVDPQDQPGHTFPNNLLQTTSLQSPTTPIEYHLWRFDERRGQLTQRAAKRIKTDKETEKTFLSITDSTTTCPLWTTKETQTSDSSSEEETETPIETQLLHERRKQKLLRKRINLLLNRLTMLE